MKYLCFLLMAAVTWGADVQSLIRDLGAENHATREAASQRLIALAATDAAGVLSNCWREYRQVADPEVKVRLRDVMQASVDKYIFRVPRAFLGVSLRTKFPADGARLDAGGVSFVEVQTVNPGTAAERAGLQAGDLILSMNGVSFVGTNLNGFIQSIQTKKPGTTVKFEIMRAEKTNQLDATLGQMPEADMERIYTLDKSEAFFKEWMKLQIQNESRR